MVVAIGLVPQTRGAKIAHANIQSSSQYGPPRPSILNRNHLGADKTVYRRSKMPWHTILLVLSTAVAPSKRNKQKGARKYQRATRSTPIQHTAIHIFLAWS